MRHVLLALIPVAVGAAVGFGQPPSPLPPSVTGTPEVTPAGGATPAPRTPAESPIARFDPLAAFPATTQTAVRAVLLGSGWLTRMNQPQGRFLFGYNPALRRAATDDHDLKQARAALALAQAAAFAGDDRQAAVASQAVLALLAVTRTDPADPTCRVPVASSRTCNRVGFAAVLALAVYELPGADEKLVAEAERLCAFLRKQLRPDGSVHYTDGPDDQPTKVDPAGVNEYPGYALHALAAGNRLKPAAWKLDAVRKGAEYYGKLFRASPHPLLAATLTPALAELCVQAKSPEAEALVFELNDWLAGLQYQATDPRTAAWAGGFRGWADGKPVEAAPGYECGAHLQSLATAYALTRRGTDLTRADRYRRAATDAAQFVIGLQYVEANTRHFENTFRANVLVGGFHLSPADGNLRVDATAWALTGLLRFLASGAEK